MSTPPTSSPPLARVVASVALRSGTFGPRVPVDGPPVTYLGELNHAAAGRGRGRGGDGAGPLGRQQGAVDGDVDVVRIDANTGTHEIY